MGAYDEYAKYDLVTKIIKKNIRVDHFLGQLELNSDVVQQLEEFFRGKFNEEKETESKTTESNVGKEANDSSRG